MSSHYLNQCWPIVHYTLYGDISVKHLLKIRSIFQGNSTKVVVFKCRPFCQGLSESQDTTKEKKTGLGWRWLCHLPSVRFLIIMVFVVYWMISRSYSKGVAADWMWIWFKWLKSQFCKYDILHIISVCSRHETISPCTDSKVNTNYEWIANCCATVEFWEWISNFIHALLGMWLLFRYKLFQKRAVNYIYNKWE